MSGRRIAVAVGDLSWMDSGACRSVDDPAVTAAFFSYSAEVLEAAKAVCATCPVREDCLEHALALPEEHGVWGGLDEKERAKLRRRRRVSGDEIRSLRPPSESVDRARIVELARTLGPNRSTEIAALVGCHINTVYLVLRDERRRTYAEAVG